MKAEIKIFPYHGAKSYLFAATDRSSVNDQQRTQLRLVPNGDEARALEITIEDEERLALIAFLSSIPARDA